MHSHRSCEADRKANRMKTAIIFATLIATALSFYMPFGGYGMMPFGGGFGGFGGFGGYGMPFGGGFGGFGGFGGYGGLGMLGGGFGGFGFGKKGYYG